MEIPAAPVHGFIIIVATDLAGKNWMAARFPTCKVGVMTRSVSFNTITAIFPEGVRNATLERPSTSSLPILIDPCGTNLDAWAMT
jgi:hypothetical protein